MKKKYKYTYIHIDMHTYSKFNSKENNLDSRKIGPKSGKIREIL